MRKIVDLIILIILIGLFFLFIFLPTLNVIPKYFDLLGGMAVLFFITFILILWRGLVFFRIFQYSKPRSLSMLINSICFIFSGLLVFALTLVRCDYIGVGLLLIVLEFYCIPMAYFYSIKNFLPSSHQRNNSILISAITAIPVSLLFFSVSSFYQFLVFKKTTELLGLVMFSAPGGLLASIITFFVIHNHGDNKNE
jgi:hypothetical protein